MAVNMIVFEYRENEKEFFEQNTFDNFNIIFYVECLNEEFVKTLPQDVLDNANVISVFIKSEVTNEVINSFKNLRIISTRSTGYDHICLNSARERNIAVVNVENYGETSVAQYTMGLVIALVRQIIPASLYLKNIPHQENNFTGRDLSKLTFGVIGTGAIGAAVCRAAKCFNMNIVAYDLTERRELAEELNLQYLVFDDLLRNSDVISLHIPYTGNNYHMIGKEQFEMMKDGAMFINTSRGEIVDLPAMYEFIENKKLGGAALDVLACESINFGCKNLAQKMNSVPMDCLNEAVYVEKLEKFSNVIITPHIAYDTQDSIDYILDRTMRSVMDIIRGGKMSRIV